MSEIKKFVDIMQAEGIHSSSIKVFEYYYQQLEKGEKGKLSKAQISTPNSNQLIYHDSLTGGDTVNLRKLAIIKLNGGLGTSMGLSKAKSLLTVKDGYTFLDIIAQQTLLLRETCQIDLPLLFMNSFVTSSDTLEFLQKYQSLELAGLPLEFIQNRFLKVRKDSLSPLQNEDETQNWNPPGHGDIYGVLQSTGILQSLLDRGIEYVFISNSDNLGATVDTGILNKMVAEGIEFVMEVCDRTENDKKGGHLAAIGDRLTLREVAQCPENEVEEFQDIEVYKYFNTNNLWVNLKSLQKLLETNKDVLPLPLILNEKKVAEVPVYQLETAMGSAISLFENSKACVVPRSRFLPVKKNQDLLLLWSDVYSLDEHFELKKNEGAIETILDLDPNFYSNIDQLKTACQKGIPSLAACKSLTIRGNVSFGENVVFRGDVKIETEEKLEIRN
ncbi:MAG: UTP--glucose-1-phosphate uridylyltransferase [Candidatus Cloacimonetes bacterium]|nr:UTP--glucose-1-phosphate uridylyltransferase [Candidatus Cloacimonadota bacterium]